MVHVSKRLDVFGFPFYVNLHCLYLLPFFSTLISSIKRKYFYHSPSFPFEDTRKEPGSLTEIWNYKVRVYPTSGL